MNALIRSITSKFKKTKTRTQELFKFSWTIENVTVWNYDREFESPCFQVKELGNEALCLVWEEEQDTKHKCSIVLRRKKRDGTPEEVNLRYCIKVPKQSITYNSTGEGVVFGVEEGRGWFIKNRILENNAWRLLSGEVHFECTILKPDISGDVPMQKSSTGLRPCEECSARTRFKTKTVSYQWNIEHFSVLRVGDRESVEIFLPSENSPRFLATLFLTDKIYEMGTVEMNISNLSELQAVPTFVACKVTFGKEDGTKIVKFPTHVFDSENTYAIWTLPVHIRKQFLVKQLEILQDDVLPILLEFMVDEGIEFSRIDKTACKLVSCVMKPSMKRVPKNKKEKLSKTKQNYQTLLTEQKLCDVLLETPTKSIGAHKIIICAKSPVFASMFEHDTLEKAANTIQVKVVTFETLECFLKCLYTEGLGGDLEVKEATELYFAADYYQVGFLKSDCSLFLTRNLEVENVCDVLSLADRHQDKDLMDSVRGFIRRRKSQVLDSEEWNKLSTERPQFVIEILQCLYKDDF